MEFLQSGSHPAGRGILAAQKIQTLSNLLENIGKYWIVKRNLTAALIREAEVPANKNNFAIASQQEHQMMLTISMIL